MTVPEVVPIIVISAAAGAMLVLGIWFQHIQRKEREAEAERQQERAREVDLRARRAEADVSWMKDRLDSIHSDIAMLKDWRRSSLDMEHLRMTQDMQQRLSKQDKPCYDEGKGDEK